MEQPWWPIPGEAYASGGAVTKVLDIYKWFTPHVDIIAPDIYVADAKGRDAVCASYDREDNPLFVPESHGGLEMIRPSPISMPSGILHGSGREVILFFLDTKRGLRLCGV